MTDVDKNPSFPKSRSLCRKQAEVGSVSILIWWSRLAGATLKPIAAAP